MEDSDPVFLTPTHSLEGSEVVASVVASAALPAGRSPSQQEVVGASPTEGSAVALEAARRLHKPVLEGLASMARENIVPRLSYKL